MTELTSIQSSPDAERIARLLSRTRHIHLQSIDSGMLPEGFLRGACAIDLWTSSDAMLVDEAVLNEWAESGVEFEVTDVQSFGVQSLIQQLYFPMFVRYGYCPEASDFPLNLASFRKLLTPDQLLTLARKGERIVAAGLFQPAGRTPSNSYSTDANLSRMMDAVVVVTVCESVHDAFFSASIQMLSELNVEAVRVRRTPWVTPSNAPFWLRDARCATRLAWDARDPSDYFYCAHNRLEGEEAVMMFELSGGVLTPRVVGPASAPLIELRDLIERLANHANVSR